MSSLIYATDWHLRSLGECATWLSGGTPRKSCPEYWGGSIPWISAKSLDSFFIADSDDRVTPLGAENGTRLVPENTVLFIVRGMSLKTEFRMGITTRPVTFNQDLKALVAQDWVEPKFLAYAIKSMTPTILRLVDEAGHGTGRLATDLLKALRVPTPPLSEQRRIAAVLGALDDKIELNRKMNRTLEEMAQAIFKSWFIDFDGHDDLVDSEIGPVPRGWDINGPEALVEFNPRLPMKRGTEATYVEMKSLPTSGPSVSDWATREYKGGVRFQQGDTLLARITPCLENGKSALIDFLDVDQVAFGSTEFIVLRPREGVPRVWPYCLVRHEPFRAHAIANMTGSSGRQRVSPDALKGFPIAVPPADTLAQFREVTEPLFQRITANVQESRTLAALRDTLLPKLISGELGVPEAEALVEIAS